MIAKSFTYQDRGGGGQGAWKKVTTNIGFLSNTGPDPLKNHKATKNSEYDQ